MIISFVICLINVVLDHSSAPCHIEDVAGESVDRSNQVCLENLFNVVILTFLYFPLHFSLVHFVPSESVYWWQYVLGLILMFRCLQFLHSFLSMHANLLEFLCEKPCTNLVWVCSFFWWYWCVCTIIFDNGDFCFKASHQVHVNNVLVCSVPFSLSLF